MPQKELMAREGEALPNLLEDLFGIELPSFRFTTMAKAWAPRCDIKETEKDFIITAALPGVKKEDVKIAIEGGMLTLSGERKEEKEEKGKNYLRKEMMTGSFSRSFSLPAGIHPEDIKAKHADGVLTVTLPKPAELKSRGVSVKVE